MNGGSPLLRWLLQPDVVATLLLLPAVALTLLLVWRPDSEPEAEEPRSTWPDLLRVELVAVLAVLLAVTWWALALPLPGEARADPAAPPEMAKAPWFLVGVQELLQVGEPWLLGVVLPGMLVVGLCLLPYLDASGPGDRRVPRLVAGVLGLFGLLPMLVGQLLRGPHFRLGPAWNPDAPAALAPPDGALGGITAGLLVLVPLLCPPLVCLALRRRPWGRRAGTARLLLLGVILGVLALCAARAALYWGAGIRTLRPFACSSSPNTQGASRSPTSQDAQDVLDFSLGDRWTLGGRTATSFSGTGQAWRADSTPGIYRFFRARSGTAPATADRILQGSPRIQWTECEHEYEHEHEHEHEQEQEQEHEHEHEHEHEYEHEHEHEYDVAPFRIPWAIVPRRLA